MMPWLLHHANRYSKSLEFYTIKDTLLKSGIHVGYDIQYIHGKQCRSCGGTGQHAKYSNTYPYKAYDWDTCWHCHGGWYRLPMWICLDRIAYGPYIFHRPKKREYAVDNPWTTDNMGWSVTERAVIRGYIEHQPTSFGLYALLILYWMYNRYMFRDLLKSKLQSLRYRLKSRVRKFKKLFTWETVVLEKPQRFSLHWFDAAGVGHDLDLPF